MPSIMRRAYAVPPMSAAALCLCLALGTAPLPVSGQPGDAKGLTWSQIDQGNEMRRLRDSLRLGDPLTQEDVTFITRSLLPQFEEPANRAQIDRVVRRKFRDMQSATNTDIPATFEQFTKLTADFMVNLAREEKKPPIVRVNAALLVGELNDDSKKRPWPGSLAPLVAIVADQSLAPEVRIAATAGLQRHADAARQAGAEAQAAFAEKAAPAIAALLAPPAGMDRAAADWLTGRGLAILRSLAGTAPASGIAAAAGILHDDARPSDLRVRSAAVVGAAKPQDIDPAKVVAAVESIAVALLQSEKAASDAQRPAAGKPGQEPAPPARRQAARRVTWLLATLADALFSEDTTGGVAVLLPEPTAAKDLARKLRQAATTIDKDPGREAVASALATLTGAQPQPEPQPQPTVKPATPAPEPDDNPFK